MMTSGLGAPASAPASASERASGRADDPGDDRTAGRASRRMTVAFYTAVTVGLVVSFGLWVHAVVDQPPVKLAEPRVQQDDSGARVQTLAHNQSATITYCVEVEMQAIDRDGRTLEKVVATSSSGDAIRPGQKANFVGVFTQMTATEINEELDEYVAYVTRRTEC